MVAVSSPGPRYIRASELIRLSGLHKSQVYAAIRAGDLPYLDRAAPDASRSAYYIPRQAAEAWLANLDREAEANAARQTQQRRLFARPKSA